MIFVIIWLSLLVLGAIPKGRHNDRLNGMIEDAGVIFIMIIVPTYVVVEFVLRQL